MEGYQPIYDAARAALSGSGARVEEGARQAVSAIDLRGAVEEGARRAVADMLPQALADIIADAVARAVREATPQDVRAAVEAEREACAALAHHRCDVVGDEIAAAIRARGSHA